MWNIGTAGSTAMLAFSLLPLALYAESPCRFTFFGGLFQDFAPTAFHMQKVLFPVLGRMGLDIRLEIIRPGYVPEGQGCLAMTVQPLSVPPRPVNLPEQGDITRIRGISLESHLEKEKVAERMAGRCREILENGGLKTTIDVHHDTTAVQKGAALLLWAETDSGCRLGADQAGRRGRRSEAIAEFVCRSLMEDLNTGASVDRHLADQLILFAALARGRSVYAIPMPTDHIQSNCWLIREMLGAESNLLENRLIIEGTGFSR